MTAQAIEQLRQQIRHVETAQRISDAPNKTTTVTTGIRAIDSLLPEGGYPRGTIIEWLSPTAGCGAEWLALHTASRAVNRGNPDHTANAPSGTIVVIDPQREFFAPAARALGIRNDQLIVIHSPATQDLYWAIDQALRCTAITAVVVFGAQTPRIGTANTTATPTATATANSQRWPALLEQIDERWLRRFQLSAEQSGALGLFVRPISVARQPSWCEVQWRVRLSPQPDVAASTADRDSYRWRPLSLQLLKCRGAAAGQQLHLSWNTQTGEVQTLRPTRWVSSPQATELPPAPTAASTTVSGPPSPSPERRCG